MTTPAQIMRRFDLVRCDEDDFVPDPAIFQAMAAAAVPSQGVSFFTRNGKPAAFVAHAFHERVHRLVERFRGLGMKCDTFASWASDTWTAVLVHLPVTTA